MERRGVLKASLATTVAAAAGSVALAAPAISQNRQEIILATTWPRDFPGVGTGAQRFADRVTRASGGRMLVRLYAAKELMPAFDVFDAAAAGDIHMYHGAEYYWQEKSKAYNFFAAVPLGLTASEFDAWINHAGGQELWDELSAAHNIKPLPCGNTGVQMAGWFREEITSVDDLKGLTMRIPGLGGEVIRAAGANTISTPGGEIMTAFEDGRINAAEWIGPWNDLALGLYKVARYYYYPGLHEPGSARSLGINLDFWNGLPSEDRQIILDAAASENNYMLSEFNAHNGRAMQELIELHGVQIRRMERVVFRELALAARDVVADAGNQGNLARRIYNSFLKFQKEVGSWTELSEQAYVEARARYI
ncbi:MAG: TRAP transporter substrate-binding protein [Alphaproteobacteria bacterium]